MIRFFSSKFRVLGQHRIGGRTGPYLGPAYTSTNKGVPIYWLDGDKVADDYEDFYDGSWDNKNGKGKNESGTGFSSGAVPLYIWSGTKDDGTKASHITTNGQFSGPLGHRFVPAIFGSAIQRTLR